MFVYSLCANEVYCYKSNIQYGDSVERHLVKQLCCAFYAHIMHKCINWVQVCITTCTLLPLETILTCENLVQQLQLLLSDSITTGAVTVRHVCDMLFRASLAHPSPRLIIPTYKLAKVNIHILLHNNSEQDEHFN